MLHVALLRGVNVGGNNVIRMAALKACLEAAGFARVTTYIQSGNVLLDGGPATRAAQTRRIERALAGAFGYGGVVILRTRRELERVVARAPAGFGAEPGRYRYDVLFLKEPLGARAALREVATCPGVDEARAGPGVLYFARLASQASRSLLPRIVGTPLYASLSIRSWNTTTRLLELMARAEAERGGAGPSRRVSRARGSR